MTHKQVLPQKTKKYRVVIVDHYSGTQKQLPGLFDSWSSADSAIREHFKDNPPKTVTEYDIGGYIETVDLDLAYNPRTGDEFNEPDEP